VKKIKFLTKSNMSEYVDDENRLECWGGQDTWEYKFEPESRHSNGLKEEGRKKTVTFAGSPMVASPSADSLGSALSSNSGGGSSGGGPQGVDLLHLNPAQEVVFSTSPLGDLTGKVCLTNTSGKPLGYKIKTTSPEKYRVRPSTGSISPGQSVTVEIHVSGQKEQVASLSRDKFLVTAVLLDREDIPAAQLADALRTQTPDGQYRLRCNLAGAPETGSGIGQVYASPPPATAPEDPARQVANVSKKVAQLVEGQQQLAGQVRQLHLLLLLMLILLLATLLVLLYRLPSSDNLSCLHSEIQPPEPHQAMPMGGDVADVEKTEL